jgi:molecular chaperone DnaK
LSEEEIKNMVKDAEAHAAEDRKFHELVDARNQADNMIHAVTKSMKEAGDKVPADEKQAIEKAIESLKEVLKGNDKDLIDSKTKELADASGKMAERVYAQGQTQGAPGGTTEEQTSEKPQGENIVDAEFEEVKDDKKN